MKKSELSKTEPNNLETPARRGRSESSKKKATPAVVETSSGDMKYIMEQINSMNEKFDKVENSVKEIKENMNNVMLKEDNSIKTMMKELLIEMKDDLLKSVIKNIEILEGKLFDKENENQKMREQISQLEKEMEHQNEKYEELKSKIEKHSDNQRESQNQTEQYSRRNNIRISGIEDTDERETAYRSGQKVVDILQKHKVCNISLGDIDIAHRLPTKKKAAREIIVKFHSRIVKEEIMKNRRNLKGTGVFINEDLTSTNQMVLMSLKKKCPDEVERAWSKNGKLLFKHKTGNIVEVKYQDFQHWLDLPWP